MCAFAAAIGSMATERAVKATTMARIVLMAGPEEDYPPISQRSSDVIVSPIEKIKIEWLF
jgi:hypothetical protein